MNPEEEKRAGVMFRVDVWTALTVGLTDAQAGKLFLASLAYAAAGTSPEFGEDDWTLSRLWDLQKREMDRDAELFRARMRRRAYEEYARYSQRKRAPILSFEDWTRMYEKGGGSNGATNDAGLY